MCVVNADATFRPINAKKRSSVKQVFKVNVAYTAQRTQRKSENVKR